MKNTKRAIALLEEVDHQKGKPRSLKERTRHVIRSSLEYGEPFETMPLPLPQRMKTYLTYPELKSLEAKET